MAGPSLRRATADDAPEVRRATPEDAATIAALAGELLAEIMAVTGQAHFDFDLAAATARLSAWLADGSYRVWLAGADTTGEGAQGFVAVTPTRAVYAGGEFGLVPECYVRPDARSRGVGHALLDAVRAHGREAGWSRLEVTTPPLPAFGRTLAFYEREGFAVAGGRKLRTPL